MYSIPALSSKSRTMQANANMVGDQNQNQTRAVNMSDPRLIITDDPATPIHTCFAKVYTMNPNNKIWIASSKNSVPISFYFDKHRSVYRIISYDGSTLVVNSTVTPSMHFLKSSSTFGLWSDTKLRTIYGLGFASQQYRDQFGEWYDKITKAATALEHSLPLPPQANTAVSISYGDSVTNWQQEGAGTPPSNDYIPPKTVHLVDSTIDLPEQPALYQDRVEEEYDLDGQPGTAELAHLALKSLQYEREAVKVKQLEIDMTSMRSNLTTIHDSLQKKTADGEKLKKELADITEELQNQVQKVEAAEKVSEEQKEQVISLKVEVDTLKSALDEQKSCTAELQKQNEEIVKENGILKERLRQTQNELETTDRNWDFVELACGELTDKIQGLVDIQGRLKQLLPVPPPPSEEGNDRY